eukprot:4345207-Prymnesium_polylepis.1
MHGPHIVRPLKRHGPMHGPRPHRASASAFCVGVGVSATAAVEARRSRCPSLDAAPGCAPWRSTRRCSGVARPPPVCCHCEKSPSRSAQPRVGCA